MSVINAFLATWSNARQTYGEGTPQTGAQYDKSSTLRELESNLASAASGSRWTGSAATGYDTANTEHRRVIGALADLDRRLAAEVDNSAVSVDAGRRNLDSLRQWVIDAAASVPAGPQGEQMRMVIAQKGLAQLQEIVKQSNSESNAIGGRIQKLGEEFQALGNQRFGPKEGPEGLGAGGEKKDDKEPEELGAEDSEALQNGQLTPEQHDRLVANTTLTADQQTALDNATLTLPPDQMAYLQGYSRAFGDKTPSEIKAIMDKAGADGGRVADVFQLASNPNIKTGLPETQPPSISEPSSGGKYALPDGIQKVLDGPALTPLGYGEPVRNADGSMGPPELISPSQPTSGLNDLANIIQQGNRDLQVGSALDAGLFEQSRQLLEQSNGWAVPGNDLEHDRPRWQHQLVDPTLQNMFNAVNKDDMVIHGAITGAGGERFLDNLTQHQWQDDGLAAGGLFDWIGESAANDSTGRAASTAHALAEYTSSHSNPLLNLPGTDGQALGQVNPELTRDWARAFSPYMDDMVGMDTGDSNGRFAPLDVDGGNLEPVNTRQLMSVLFSDHPPLDQPADLQAPQTASQIATESAQAQMHKMFDIGAASLADSDLTNDHYAMKSAGKLQAALDLGAYDERFDVSRDAETAAKQAHEMRSRLWDLGKDLISEIPGAGVPAAFGNFTKDFMIGPEPIAPGVDGVRARDMLPVQVHMAASLAAEGYGDPAFRAQLQQFMDNGQLTMPDQVNEEDRYRDFYDAVTSYLGENSGVHSLVQEYWNAYSGAITNANQQ